MVLWYNKTDARSIDISSSIINQEKLIAKQKISGVHHTTAGPFDTKAEFPNMDNFDCFQKICG